MCPTCRRQLLRAVGPRPPRPACGAPRPGERLHYPDCESLLLNEGPEVVVVDHPSPPDIAAQCFRAFRCGPTAPCLVRRIAARCCRPDGLRPRLAAIGDGPSH